MNDTLAYFPFVLKGVYVTIGLSLSSAALATIFGLLRAWAKLSTSSTARRAADLYTTVCRGISALGLMLLLYYVGHALLNKIGDVTGLWRFLEFNQFAAGFLSIGFIF